jgi:SAM-dependent methyltransferase
LQNPFDLIAQTQADEIQEVVSNGPFPIRFAPKSLPQDEEWCEVRIDNVWKRIRFHDYHEVYKVPGLYETIFYRTLRCNSPNRVSNFINEVMVELGLNISGVRALDLGAGNGMSGEALQNLGIRKIVGVDLLPEAREATLRDRPWVYDHYFVADFTNLTQEQNEFLKDYKFNLLCTVAALGFGDIPPLAFYNAFNLVADGGVIAFNIRNEFLKRNSGSPFANLISSLIEHEVIEIELLKNYQHRLNTQGQPIYYNGLVARKNGDIPDRLLTRLNQQ